jgi:hypothetical protein
MQLVTMSNWYVLLTQSCILNHVCFPLINHLEQFFRAALLAWLYYLAYSLPLHPTPWICRRLHFGRNCWATKQFGPVSCAALLCDDIQPNTVYIVTSTGRCVSRTTDPGRHNSLPSWHCNFSHQFSQQNLNAIKRGALPLHIQKDDSSSSCFLAVQLPDLGKTSWSVHGKPCVPSCPS